jgi:hypothetical protein
MKSNGTPVKQGMSVFIHIKWTYSKTWLIQNSICEISSSHGSGYEAQNLLGCTAVFLIGCRPTFQRYVLPPSSGRLVSLA